MASSALAENIKVALLLSVWVSGPEVIVVMGGVVSAVSHSHSIHSRASVPAGPVARTAKRCSPANSPVYVTGDVQGVITPSSQHWKVDPGILDWKVKVT